MAQSVGNGGGPLLVGFPTGDNDRFGQIAGKCGNLERTTMKKLNKAAMLIASIALATPLAVFAQMKTPTAEELKYANGSDTWQNVSGTPWMNAAGTECWRDASWTPATAYPGCDGAAKPPPPPPAPMAAAAPPPPPAAAPAPPPPPVVAVVPPAKPAAQKVAYAADTFFDFDKSVIKPEGQAKLKDLVDKTKGISLEVIIAVGYTDSVGTPQYNVGLSNRRAAAVKAYLVSQGIPANRIYTEGKGERDPIASNSTSEGRAKNRRVEIEVVGTRPAP
jgi:OOP family OmpA-OmpF porin